MKNLQRIIWIEAEQWAEGQWDIEDVNTDVIVVFSNKLKWVASFFTYKNINTRRENNRKTGECMNGAYLWFSDMVLIDIGSKERIHEVIHYLIETDEFQNVFTSYPDVEIEDDEYYPKGFFDNDS
ncbi:hypothetical protein BVG16_30770 [Paenibacillus selenitireducens]|uniref:Uncharacterized protein n=1 Tax=Paenibacillus selenitireducens TaxID=1324314 RepID=A0A1T2X0D1_9BACL|nr:hypothetical protein [Paenibacillus selenitireducens]OPA73053.1 hypothetical protein BVG16_30770 [Paenibacillus selenitireducens]